MLLNSEPIGCVEVWNEFVWLSYTVERGTTQTEVKASKYWLNVEGSSDPQTAGL